MDIPREHPKVIGERATLAVMLGLAMAGYRMALPFGENVRYDVVIDDGRDLARVQCKSGRLRQGAVRFKASSSYAHHRRRATPRDYLEDVDFFGVHCPETSGVYLIPILGFCCRRRGALRVDPPRNNQRRRIRLASDYEIARIPTDRLQAGGPPLPWVATAPEPALLEASRPPARRNPG